MPRDTFDVLIDPDRIICHYEGDGCGVAEPYLWTVFFRIGGDDVSLVPDSIDWTQSPPMPIFHIAGSAFVKFCPGSHGNLGTRDVDAGDVIPIPEAIGQFQTQLKPIAIPQELKDYMLLANQDVEDDVAGLVGAVVVLMEEDSVTDDGAEAGHTALNNAIKFALQSAIDTLSNSIPQMIKKPEETKEKIDSLMKSLTSGVADKVEDAIASQQSLFENLWAALDPDDEIGNHVFMLDSDDLKPRKRLTLEKRWEEEGDWEIRGEVIPAFICLADAMADFFNTMNGSETVTYDREALIHFRDYRFAKYPGAFRWWDRIQQNKMQIVSLMLRDPQARDLGLKLFNSGQRLIKTPDKPIPNEEIERAKQLLNCFRNSKKRRTKIEAIRALDFVSRCEGKTIDQILRLMNVHTPSRHH